MTRDQFAALMAEIGPLNDYLAVYGDPDGPLWHIAIDEDLIVALELDTETGVLTLSGSAATPAAGRTALYETMLRYNCIWRETGGLSLGLDPDGAVELTGRVPAAGLERTALSGLIASFGTALTGWREVVAGAPAADQQQGQAADAAPDHGLDIGYAIRG